MSPKVEHVQLSDTCRNDPIFVAKTFYMSPDTDDKLNVAQLSQWYALAEGKLNLYLGG